MSNRAAHRRIRLFLHAGDDRSGCQGNSRRPLYGHVRHRPFPDGGELSRVSALSAARARADAGAKMKVGTVGPAVAPIAGTRRGCSYFIAQRGLALPGPWG